MGRASRFRILLPAAQCLLAALFGGVGLWQRSAILSRPWFSEGQTMWNTTARFHVWPLPYKFAAVVNMPAFLAGDLLGWPIGERWPELPESVLATLQLLLVPILWYWVGFRLDRRWNVTDPTPWIALSIFTLVCLVGAFLPIGYVGFLPYGFVVWVITALTISRRTYTRSGIPAPDINKKASPN
jgi:hypothetical protein